MKTGTINSLSNALEHIDYPFNFVMGVVYRKVPEDGANNTRCLHVLRTREDIQDYLSRNEFDMIVLTYPEHMLVVLTQSELGWIKRTDKLAEWISKHWKSELLIISVS